MNGKCATSNAWENELAGSYALLAQVLAEAPRRNRPELYDVEVWRSFPLCGVSPSIAAAAGAVADECPGDEDALVELGADYGRLFVGPPKPAAMPWQTTYANPNATSLSGTPALEVRRCMGNLGLRRSDGNGQLEDHIGTVLMVAAVMADRGLGEDRRAFVERHVLSWIGSLIDAVEAAQLTSFYGAVLRLAREVSSLDAASPTR